MEHKETHLVTLANGVRPAGPPDACFYCGVKLGLPHETKCVLRRRTVVVRAIFEYTVEEPEDWSIDMILFHRNESSWCANRAHDELGRLIDNRAGSCLCHISRFEFVREATAEDEKNSWGGGENMVGGLDRIGEPEGAC